MALVSKSDHFYDTLYLWHFVSMSGNAKGNARGNAKGNAKGDAKGNAKGNAGNAKGNGKISIALGNSQ